MGACEHHSTESSFLCVSSTAAQSIKHSSCVSRVEKHSILFFKYCIFFYCVYFFLHLLILVDNVSHKSAVTNWEETEESTLQSCGAAPLQRAVLSRRAP